MNNYNLQVCETRIITTDLDIQIMADSREDAEALALDYLEDDKLRSQLNAAAVIAEDIREYEIIPEEDVLDFDDTDQLTLPEIVIPVQEIQEMPKARR